MSLPLPDYPITRLPNYLIRWSLQRPLGQQCGNFLTDACDKVIALLDVDVPGFNGPADANRERHGPDDEAAPDHGRASARDRHGHDGGAGLDGHPEPALLERQELVRPAARALGQ